MDINQKSNVCYSGALLHSAMNKKALLLTSVACLDSIGTCKKVKLLTIMAIHDIWDVNVMLDKST